MRRTLLSFLVVLPFAVLSVGACGGSAFDSGLGTGGTGTAVGGTGATPGGSSNGGTGNVAGVGASAGSAGADIQACTSNSDCEVQPVSCTCGTGPLSNLTAINTKYVNQYYMRCPDLGSCPPAAFNPNDPALYYVATCQAGRCAVVDLGATDVTECKSASDCSLRSGTGCCEGCGSDTAALNTSKLSELSKLVCGSEPVACSACAPVFSGYSADCSNGRCSVLLTPCTTEHPCPL